jgi:hypothetical protein
MISLYDDALRDYLKSINENFAIVPVKDYWNVISMHKEGKLQMPAIVLFRTNWTPDRNLISWPVARKGRIDRIQEHKKIKERAIPVLVDYTVTLLATTQDDIDDLTSEVTFEFIMNPRLTIPLPYGSNRFIHGQIKISGDYQNSSGNDRFSETGILYQQIIPIQVLGANIIDIRKQNLRYLQWVTDTGLLQTIKEEMTDAKNQHS